MDAKMPSAVMAMGQLYRWKESRDVPDTINAILQYPEGFAVNLGSSFNNQFSSEAGFQVLGTEGALTITGSGMNFYPENVREDNRWIVEAWPHALEDAYYKDPKVIASEVQSPRCSRPAIQDEGPDPTLAHMGNFLDSIRTRKPFWEDAVAGHHAAACAHLINLSAKKETRRVGLRPRRHPDAGVVPLAIITLVPYSSVLGRPILLQKELSGHCYGIRLRIAANRYRRS